MKNLYLLLLFLLFTSVYNRVSAQNISNEGSDFWIPFPTHDPSGTNLANMNVFVTCKTNSQVTVSCGTYTETKAIPANTVVAFAVPRANSYINATESNTVLTNRAIHVVTTAGMPNVAVYAHIYAGARSAASLILPKEALGQKYHSMNFTQDSGGQLFLVLVAIENNTTLLIRPKLGANLAPGPPITVTLPNAGDVYEYIPSGATDLTGTAVEVDQVTSQCKRFASFSGSTSNTIGCTGTRDPLFQQLYPINSWGKNYGIVPFIDRRYILRVIAQDDNTSVNIAGGVTVINKGEFIETRQRDDAIMVTADKLISVAQYSLTQSCSTIAGGNIIGDPDMVVLNPIEFNIKNITVFSSSNQAIQTKYINVFMKTDKSSTFRLNGAVPSASWQVMAANPNYSFIQIPVAVESLTLSADDGFNAIAYGYGNAESYAYSAGTSLASREYLILVNKTTNQESTAACINQAADFKLTLPYVLDKIIWKLGDGDADYTEISPPYVTSVVGNETFYTYSAPVNKTFTSAGPKTLTALATLAASQGACSSSEVEFNFTVEVYPLPTADFTTNTTACENEVVSFTDKSISNASDKPITKWVWDFGDGSTASTVQNPTHTYTSANTFHIKLFVGTDVGCFSEVVTKDITINPKATALFNAKKNSCISTNVVFTDQSASIGGTISKWTWDFGDGTAIDNTQNPNHSYAAAGTYTIKLIVETDKGCISQPYTAAIAITGLPVNDFSLPDVCLSDAQALFANTSTDYDGSIAGLTYLWNFGDPASGALNTSTDRDGVHKYNAAANYNVTLTIVNTNGCTVVKSQSFTVNGSSPKASFTPPSGSVCSNTTFSVTNTSTVDFGKITRIEWYIDNVKYSEDEDPTPGKIYDFTYPEFTAPSTKTIVLKLMAYSGSVSGSCSNSALASITLNASPVVQFDPLQPICYNGGLLQFTATETGGLTGNGIYSGDGVSATGQFNPVVAGIGLHDITYTFTATNGCTDSETQQIEVFPIPVVDAGADFYILSGGEKRIDAQAAGIGLTFKWSPSAGLDHDDILNPVATPGQDTKYTLTVTSSQGCTVTDDILIKVLQNVNAPNSFTPNGDGINDVWNIKYLDTYPNGTVEIFDRTGQRIFASKGYAVPFDGTYRNQALPVGVYYYVINPNSGRKSITGSLTIIK
jgi:gliding motility-associated-like protein